jgi:hypothetical protein
VYVAGRNLLGMWRHRHHADGAHPVTIAPPPEVDAKSAAALWANLAGTLTPSRRRRLLYGSPHVVWQYGWIGRRLLIPLWVPGTVPPGAVEAAGRAAWPGAACSTEPAGPPIPLDVPAAVGGQLLPVAADWLPFRSEHDSDPLRALMSAAHLATPGHRPVRHRLLRGLRRRLPTPAGGHRARAADPHAARRAHQRPALDSHRHSLR